VSLVRGPSTYQPTYSTYPRASSRSGSSAQREIKKTKISKILSPAEPFLDAYTFGQKVMLSNATTATPSGIKSLH
jgi:hypothetical protein